MRPLVFLFAALWHSFPGSAAHADVSAGIYAERVQNGLAEFQYAANPHTRGDGKDFVRYVVCNGHASLPLQFKWREPGMASGSQCPLAVQQCGILSRNAPFGVQPAATTLDYVQTGFGTVTPTVGLPAPDPAPPGAAAGRDGWLSSAFYAVFGQPGDCPAELFEAEIAANAAEGGSVQLYISYSPRRITVAIALDDKQLETADVEQIGAAMERLGGSAAVTPVSSLIEEDHAAELSSGTGAASALALTMGAEGQLPVFLDLGGESRSLINAPVILASEGRMLARFDAWVWLPDK